MEMLTKTHPLVIWGMYMPVIIYFIYLSHFSLEFSYLADLFHYLWRVHSSGPSLNI